MVKTRERSGGSGSKQQGGRRDQKWNAKCRALEAFKAEHGHCNVPRRHGSLGNWMHKQRTEYKKGKLSKERVQQLGALGFDWSPGSTLLTWDERFDELTKYKAEHGDCRILKREGPLGEWVSQQRTAHKKGKLSDERAQELDALGFLWNPTPTWDERLDELMKYKVEHGDCNVPKSQGPLGKWVATQRFGHKMGKLSEERARKLGELGFVWNPQSTLPTWDERFDELEDFKAEHGHCKVPRSRGPLGRWVQTQRHVYKKGKLSEELIRKLDGLNFNWETTRGTPITWDERFNELTKYKAEQGDCKVPKSQGSLGTWVDTQRQEYRKGKLSDERVQKLGDIGFSWATLHWDERFGELTKYKAEHGHCNVPQKQGHLGRWVANQRTGHKMGKLSEERVRKLEDLGIVWNPTPSWDERLDELTKYKAKHGHCNVPQSQGSLGIWVQSQRAAYKKGKLSEERVQKLEDLGFCWVVIPNSERRRTSGSRPRSDADEAREGEGGGGRERKSRNAAADDAGTASAPAIPEECVSNAAEYDGETDSEIDTKSLKPEDVLIKTETDDESSIGEH